MSIQIEKDLGTLTIDSEVIAKIAGYAALESYGIVGMASKNTKEGIFELLKIDYLTKGIVANTNDDRIIIDLNVILEYGINIDVVSQNIIDNVRYNVKNITGLEVDEVNVIVQGIRID